LMPIRPITLILLPGMDGTGSLFRPFIDAVGTRFKIKVVQYPTDRAMDYPALLGRVRSELPANEPYVVLGESFSGPIAVELAAESDTLCQGLILCCTFVRNPRPLLSGLKFVIQSLPMWMPPVSVLSKLLLGKFSTPALRLAMAQAIAQVTPAVMRGRVYAVLCVDVTAQMVAVKTPILYLRATQDKLVPRSASEWVCHLNARTHVVDIDAPHCLLQTTPQEAAQVVQKFLIECQSTAF
jgi:pimeloyl-ACP methyl ester carboxylesterase